MSQAPEDRAAKRLLRDQLELVRNASALHHVSGAPLDDNIREWHANLRVIQGKLAGMILHLELHFPDSYPTKAPRVVVCTNLPHPNVHRSGNAYELCCDMLGNCADNATMGGSYHGWSSSYSVLSVLMQLQAFLLDGDLMFAFNTSGTTIAQALEDARNYTCTQTGHTYDEPWPAFNDAKASLPEAATLVTLPSAVFFEFESTKRRRLQAAAKASNGASKLTTPIQTTTKAISTASSPTPTATPVKPVKDEWQQVGSKFAPQADAPALDAAAGVGVCSANSFDGLLKRQAFKRSVLSKAKPKQKLATRPPPSSSSSEVESEPELTKAQKKNKQRAEKRRLKREQALLQAQVQAQQPAGKPAAPSTDSSSNAIPAAPPSAAVSMASATVAKREELSGRSGVTSSRRSFLDGSDSAGFWCKVKYEDVLSILSFLCAADVGSVQCSCWYLHDMGCDGNLWRDLFSVRYPHSSKHISAATMAGWKHLYQIEREQVTAMLRCFHSKRSFAAPDFATLGVPCVLTTNPRTGLVDYIYSSFDPLSHEAFKHEGVRTDASGTTFTHFMPLYLSHEHFERAIEQGQLQRALLRLCDGWYYDSKTAKAQAEAEDEGTGKGRAAGNRGRGRFGQRNNGRGRGGGRDSVPGMLRSDSFHPNMALEVLPRLMNTMVVLMSDKGVHASDRAIDGYCQCHRLLVALLQRYPALQVEVQRRLTTFLGSESSRSKRRCPNLGLLLPLLSISNEFSWVGQFAKPVLQETFDRNVLWICREHPSYEKLAPQGTGTGVEEQRLQQAIEASAVSRRLLMFHAAFLRLVARPTTTSQSVERVWKWASVEEVAMRADRLYGCPDLELKSRFRKTVGAILAADTWPAFFDLVGFPCPSKAQLTTMLRDSVKGSARKGYHTPGMDFSRVHSSGVSKILLKGESYSASPNLAKVKMQEVWHWSTAHTLFLDASALMYDFDGKYQGYVDYSSTEFTPPGAPKRARPPVVHSGDQIDPAKSQGVHTIELELKAMPTTGAVYFTMSAWSNAKLVDIKQPYVRLFDVATDSELCQYTFDKRKEATFGKQTAIVMCKLHRQRPGAAWSVTALGSVCHGQAGNYEPMLAEIARIEGKQGGAAMSA